jgi:hypothetical protein
VARSPAIAVARHARIWSIWRSRRRCELCRSAHAAGFRRQARSAHISLHLPCICSLSVHSYSPRWFPGRISLSRFFTLSPRRWAGYAVAWRSSTVWFSSCVLCCSRGSARSTSRRITRSASHAWPAATDLAAIDRVRVCLCVSDILTADDDASAEGRFGKSDAVPQHRWGPMRWFILIAVQCSFRAVLHQTPPQE